LGKSAGGRKRKASGKKPESPTVERAERGEEGGPDEAVAFIAESVADLTKLAKRHRLEILWHLLGMAQLEAEEHLRLRSKRKLS
jgi:hypothetical protein